MERWSQKVAVVTGASSGIGASIAVELAKAGLIVIGLARRKERVDKLASDLAKNVTGKLIAFQCDVSKEDEIIEAFTWINERYGGVDVLVNNAGIIAYETLLTSPGNAEKLRNVLDVNVMGVVLCTREAFQSMKKRQVDGHIITINSTLGHTIPISAGTFNIYPPSKYAVTAINEMLRHEFRNSGTKIKITVRNC